ncbi:MAG: hypothetical protein RLZZ593_847 [Bacteroidota bacterium]|jgi:hypothetical protein
MSQPQKPAKKPLSGLKQFGRFSAIGIQMGATIYFMVQIGTWADDFWSLPGRIGVIVGTLFGLVTSIWLVIKETKKMDS